MDAFHWKIHFTKLSNLIPCINKLYLLYISPSYDLNLVQFTTRELCFYQNLKNKSPILFEFPVKVLSEMGAIHQYTDLTIARIPWPWSTSQMDVYCLCKFTMAFLVVSNSAYWDSAYKHEVDIPWESFWHHCIMWRSSSMFKCSDWHTSS